MIIKKNNFRIPICNFATKAKKAVFGDTAKFIELFKNKRVPLFDKNYLVGGMIFNVMFFCVSQRELGNIPGYSWLLKKLNYKLYNYNLFRIFSTHFDSLFSKQILFSNLIEKKKTFTKFFILLKSNFLTFLNLIQLKKIAGMPNANKYKIKKNVKKKKENQVTNQKSSKLPVNAFLLMRSTRNNFFVTVVDNQGYTLINRTGGYSEWTGTRQWASVLSADNAIYEACFLAKQRGIETLALHIRSTFRLPQIKNSIEGLETADIAIHEVLYWPKYAFGGCWLKKPRWI